ncbi:WD40 repeat-like protein [Xylona heveae TC161]|uniref:Pre-rRNA-processing protein IPI3 n=1 Tax=Xylona heveae (strain CBS 132557 / TC161) TaxID=1328760 RepID=A0A164ZMX0_XYLHT|nr:WD40 repeat-like protein [Xylona heveae TC161]KZF19293.1 WD40 repeat-like protein [Xylona heveae TC161]
MLTEQFLAATSSAPKVPNTAIAKDAGIYLHDLQPIPALKTSFKKSAAAANCVAVNDTHIFAAQAGKAVVHVYNRERGGQEATIAFPERIHSLALAGDYNDAGILVLGTEGGRIILWELCTGRQISTPQSHIQPTTSLAVDSASDYLLSGSPDSNIHVWSLSSLLSFSSAANTDASPPNSPIRTLSNHRAAITSISMGHGSSMINLAISASEDNSCIVWNVQSGELLRTFLLPATPLCLSLDPVDRACYAGLQDGSVQLINLYKDSGVTNSLHDTALNSAPSMCSPSERWSVVGHELGPTRSISVSYEGNTLLSGHETGKVIRWDIARGRYLSSVADFYAPVTNLSLLPPKGFPNTSNPKLKSHTVLKPRHDEHYSDTGSAAVSSAVPTNYTLTAQISENIISPVVSSSVSEKTSDQDFDSLLDNICFPTSILEEGSFRLSSHDPQNKAMPASSSNVSASADADNNEEVSRLKKENEAMWKDLCESREMQKRAWAKLMEWGKERAESRQRHSGDGEPSDDDTQGSKHDSQNLSSEGSSENEMDVSG